MDPILLGEILAVGLFASIVFILMLGCVFRAIPDTIPL
jgi:hypothetical protein